MNVVDAFDFVDVAAAAALPGGEVAVRADRCATVIASGGDKLFWPSQAEERFSEAAGEPASAEIARAVADGVSILACRPGGVTVAGRHWCHTPHGECAPGTLWDPPTGDRGGQGAVYTPRSLAGRVTGYGLAPLAYRPGPLETHRTDRWRLAPGPDITGLRVADHAVGTGAMPVATVRYLSTRLVRRWNRDAGRSTRARVPLSMLVAARQAVAACVHGVDIDPWAVELCRVAVALLTPTVVTDVTRRFVVGDALLGVTDWRQIQHLAPGRVDDYPQVFTAAEMAWLYSAHRLDGPAAWLPELLADLTVAWAVRAGGTKRSETTQIRGHACHLARKLVDQPDARDTVTATVEEWLRWGRPDTVPYAPPLHWALTFPDVMTLGGTK